MRYLVTMEIEVNTRNVRTLQDITASGDVDISALLGRYIRQVTRYAFNEDGFGEVVEIQVKEKER